MCAEDNHSHARACSRCRCLNVAEVQVYGRPIESLLSQGKKTYDVGAWDTQSVGSNANDGNLTNLFHSAFVDNPWWGVDLGTNVRAGLAGDESCQLEKHVTVCGAPLIEAQSWGGALNSLACEPLQATVTRVRIANRVDCCQGRPLGV